MTFFSKATSTSNTHDEVLRLLEPYGAKKEGSGWRARCPAHNGDGPNLKVDYKEGRWLFHCHSNSCSQSDIEKALGIQSAPKRNGHSREVVRYEARSVQNELWGTKCRIDTPQGKKFWWEPKGLKPEEAPLYRSQDIPSFDRSRWVYLCEGEKACDALRALGAQALGTVTGAGSGHKKAALELLRGCKVALFPDNDADHKGLLHMNRHAEHLKEIAVEVVILDSRSLPPKGDAVEWIDLQLSQGRTKQELMEVFKSEALLDLPVLTKETTPETAQPTPKPRPLLLYDFLNLEVPPREHILSPCLTTKSLNMLFAKTGLGKTWIGLGMAYAVASGGKFLRWQAPKPRGVLYLDGEMAANQMQERLSRIITDSEQGATAPFKIFCSDLIEGGIPDLSTEEGQALINEHLDDVELLVIDNLSTLVNSGKENEAESWREMQVWLQSLRRRGVSVLLIHHAGKGGSQRGTSKKEDILDTVINLRRPDDYQASEGARIEVHFDKARGLYGPDVEPFEAHLGFDPTDPEQQRLRWEVKSIEASREAQILKLHKEGLTNAEIARELDVHRSTIGRILEKAKEGRQ